MSDHISSPFLVEAFTVEIDEVNVQRLNGYDDDLGNPVSENGSVRDIDNYVFFMYRQIRGSRPRDSASDVSGSNRHLILSSSMTFWNSASIQPSNDLLHTPAFQYEWGLPYDSAPAVGAFTGSIKVEGFPSVCGIQLSNTSVVVQPLVAHAWPGGTSITRDASKGYSGVLYAFEDAEGALAVSPPNWLRSFKDTAASISLTDSHAFRKFGGENVAFSTRTIGGTSITTTGAPQSTISPFILLPTDEIVIGMEAGVPYAYNSFNIGHFTGSFMRIKNKPCRVRLFGSLISDSKELQPSLNQDLSSNSVHEIIGAEPVLDQFQIEPVSSYHGSYLDDIVTGSMASPILAGTVFITASQDQSRRLISRVSLGQAGITGSLQRFVKMNDSTERTYDSCLPSYADFFDGDVNFQVRTVNEVLGIKVQEHELVKWMPGVDDGIVEKGSFFSNQFPFKNNPTRRLSLNGTLASGSSLAGGIYASDLPQFRDYGLYSTYDNYTNFRTSDWAYRVGYSFTNVYDTGGGDRTYVGIHREKAADVLLTAEPNYELELGTYRYGISNLLPEFSSTRWHPDHYGHLRDMLEPRQHSATFDGIKPVKIRFVSGSTNVDPMLTYSQNLSTFATSSMPFFDDDIARNRPDNPDESLVDVIA
jgi:hypothetical protein